MNIIPTNIPDVLIFEPKVFGDSRGYFFESFRQDVFQKAVGKIHFVQDNQSKSSYGVLRGLHFQRPPFTQSKLVRCMEGEVLDVAVDIRVGSPTYGEHAAVRLSAENQRQLWVPQGFAHGFVVLSDTAVFAYKCDNYYAPEYDGGLLWNDSELGIDWLVPADEIRLSDKDQKQPVFSSIKHFNYDDFKQEKVYPKIG
ncbi:dTDP-4-dehydrorhamnose 3,5-epimerase [Mangrovibacterium diazotrophicum]|uniref:dTDP-4-dehydrorhamnose 3,5-epimerase n=1 Tax=Mangrovibacterium diazotrophicum TaxID=1261403 RepID=A0A419W5Q6_9BACT|nr:dTDP-4-dehydrorhamnose 3,5-epimerase [Mangrovibacterium diazotrophicum]RKD90782.1 dTDP-4-dehydrorhamnose 3,5-epimerase [Mangrovibacterium diazotrophicum]